MTRSPSPWRRTIARFTDNDVQAELVAHATGRAMLCTATGLHDVAPNGTCRDCGARHGPDAAVCDDTRRIDAPRTPFGGWSS